MSAGNQTVVARVFDEVLNESDEPTRTGAVIGLFAPNSVFTDALDNNPSDILQYVGHWRRIFPDITFKITQLRIEQDLVSVRWTAIGTHTGDPFGGVQAQGATVRVSGLVDLRIDGGQVRDTKIVFDLVGLLEDVIDWQDPIAWKCFPPWWC
jgi:predicted ester cyclase